MVYLRKTTVDGTDYFYLYYISKENGFFKFKRYIGKKRPTENKLKELKNKFLNDIKNNPKSFFKDDKNVIERLQDIQEKKGYISDEDLIKLAKNLDLHMTDIFGAVTFYSQFKLNKPGKYKISVCRGTACHVKKSDKLLEFISKELGIKSGETTKDEKFSLESVNCIGACAKAPAIMINNKVYGDLTKDKIKKIIDSFK